MASSYAKIMRAVICDSPGPVSVLNLREVPVPTPQPGQVLVKVLAFGINRAGNIMPRPSIQARQ